MRHCLNIQISVRAGSAASISTGKLIKSIRTPKLILCTHQGFHNPRGGIITRRSSLSRCSLGCLPAPVPSGPDGAVWAGEQSPNVARKLLLPAKSAGLPQELGTMSQRDQAKSCYYKNNLCTHNKIFKLIRMTCNITNRKDLTNG